MDDDLQSQFSNQVNVTEGSIIKSLFFLSWPMILSNLLHTMYNLVDTIWVGRVGAKAVAAISLSFPIIFVLLSIGIGFTIAGTTLVAQYTGAKQQGEVNRVVGQVFTFVLGIAIIFSMIGIIFSPYFLRWMGAAPEVFPLALSYLRVIFGGMTFMFLFFIFSALLRGWGDTMTPMKLMFLSTVLNVVLDPLLIFGIGFFPALGVTGAAVATIFSRAVAAGVSLYLLWKGDYGIQLKKKYLRPDFEMIKKIVKLGAPSAIEQSTQGLGLAFLMSTVANFGTMAVAAYGIGGRILSFVIMPSHGFSAATTTMVGQNLGANKVPRAEKSTYISTGINFVFLSVCGFILFLVPQSVIKIFNSDPEVVALGASFVRISALSFGFMGAMIVINGGFRGAGNTFTAMSFSIFSLWILRIPLANLWGQILNWGPNGVWWAIFVSNIVGALIAFYWFKRGKWKEKVVKE